jgi:signal transduction histidine kinase
MESKDLKHSIAAVNIFKHSDNFEYRAAAFIRLGAIAQLILGTALGIVVWQYWDIYSVQTVFLMPLVYIALVISSGKACALCLEDAIRKIKDEPLLHQRKWILYALVQTVLIIYFSYLYELASPTEDLTPILLIILTPQCAVYLTAWRALAVAVAANIPISIICATFSAFALFSVLMIFHAILIGFVTRSLSEQKLLKSLIKSNSELNATQLQLSESVKHDERLRISRDLHDKIGHQLVALNIQLEIASHLTDGKALKEVQESKSQAKHLLDDVRNVVSELRQHEYKSMTEALDSLEIRLSSIKPSLKIHRRIDVDENTLTADTLDTLILVSQEALTNTIKHSQASLFSVTLFMDDTGYVLDIADNGNAPKTDSAGNGLKGIKERIEALKGNVSYGPQKDGFHIHATIPIQSPLDNPRLNK